MYSPGSLVPPSPFGCSEATLHKKGHVWLVGVLGFVVRRRKISKQLGAKANGFFTFIIMIRTPYCASFIPFDSPVMNESDVCNNWRATFPI